MQPVGGLTALHSKKTSGIESNAVRELEKCCFGDSTLVLLPSLPPLTGEI